MSRLSDIRKIRLAWLARRRRARGLAGDDVTR